MKNILAVIVLFAVITASGIFASYVSSKKATLGLTTWELLQNMADPYDRYVVVDEGLRKEQVADRFAETLDWSPSQRQTFLNTSTIASGGIDEGIYFPQTYLIPLTDDPEDASENVVSTFKAQVIDNQDLFNDQNNINNVSSTLDVASIIQRETNNKADMPIIAAIIYNRIKLGMNLDIDATLQYAIGTEDAWWPPVVPEDKYIDSPYNTYQNKGLPPTAISSPGITAINAALHPATTKALYYIHDSKGVMHTADTYKEQLANIAKYYPK